ncbi:MAG: PHP domain-containing protein [Candidatus Limnocylindrales bacterium]
MADAPAPGSRRPRRLRHDPAALPDPVIPPGPSRVDLHAHSRRSDGVLEPADLLRAAAACGVTTFALADHDTLVGYREVVADGAIPPGLELIAGVEINAIVREDIGLWEGELHILGLGMDTDDEAFEAALVAQRGRRAERFARTVRRLAELGMPIDAPLETLVSGPDDSLGRPIVGRALVAAGFATSVEDAFRRLIGRGRPGYIPRDGLGPEEAIRAIRAAGGLPVLAHFSEAPSRLPLLRELIAEGLAGLEVYYRAFDRPTTEVMAETAAALGLVPTGGTDYHGDTGTYAEAHARLWVPPEVGDEVRGRRRQRSSAPG